MPNFILSLVVAGPIPNFILSLSKGLSRGRSLGSNAQFYPEPGRCGPNFIPSLSLGPNAQCPMPNAQFPIPNSPIPHSHAYRFMLKSKTI
ncbi:MAG: hypothetical protein F6J93_30940 [Oscillatoria sp. SIO1A7]|nr:hypothetical protein [Oscillatoria sp. SIO1A7]